jgi:membrane-associated phospholipid phosphatase
VVDAAFGHRAGAFAFGLAAWIAASRLAENKHFLSDVAAGAGLGIVCGRAVVLGDRAGRGDRRQRAAFHLDADRLTVSLRF